MMSKMRQWVKRSWRKLVDVGPKPAKYLRKDMWESVIFGSFYLITLIYLVASWRPELWAWLMVIICLIQVLIHGGRVMTVRRMLPEQIIKEVHDA